jgi:hypothetical protein
MERGIKMPIKITNDDIILLSSIAVYAFIYQDQLGFVRLIKGFGGG